MRRRAVAQGPGPEQALARLELPEIRPGGWVWVAVDPDRRRATARWIARPE